MLNLDPTTLVIVGGLVSVIVSLLGWIALRAFAEQKEDRTTNDTRHRENQNKSDERHMEIMQLLDAQRDRTETRYNDLKVTNEEQYRRFGTQLSSLQELVLNHIHQFEVRLVKLEEWRKHRDKDKDKAVGAE